MWKKRGQQHAQEKFTSQQKAHNQIGHTPTLKIMFQKSTPDTTKY